jgi:hypothetical protein
MYEMDFRAYQSQLSIPWGQKYLWESSLNYGWLQIQAKYDKKWGLKNSSVRLPRLAFP